MVCLSKKIGLKYVAFMQRVINLSKEWRSILFSQCVGFIWNRFGLFCSLWPFLSSHSGYEASLGKSDVVEMVIYQLA